MENASKALLMAAGVLIGLLVISLAVYLFVSFGTTSADVHKQMEQQQIEQFNSQFTSYDGKEDITIYDVVTVANLATENNRYYEHNKKTIPQDPQTATDTYISVVLNNPTNTIEYGFNSLTSDSTNSYNQLIKDGLNSMVNVQDKDENGQPIGKPYKVLSKYKCQVEISQKTGRVCLVKFIKSN